MSRKAAVQTQKTPTRHQLSQGSILQRKCMSCGQHKTGGGTCTTCQANAVAKAPSILQPKLTVGRSDDSYEKEADRVAEQVMRIPALNRPQQLEEKPLLRRTEPLVQRRLDGDRGGSEAPPIVHEVLRSPGQPLSPATQALMTSRFRSPIDQGRSFARTHHSSALQPNFSQVRLHTNAPAAAAAHAVNADAFTVKNHIVFGSGQYQPHTRQGQQLLAHELTHTLQQQTTPPRLNRRLSVNPNHPTLAPATDPAASLTRAQRFSMMDHLIQGLCNQFEVDSGTGEVLSKTRTSIARQVLASSSQPTGCCCLSVLTHVNAANWTIEVSQVVGPHTRGRQVVLSPTNTPIEFGSFTPSGNLAFQGPVSAAGHELCGHAALMEIAAHPPPQDRTTTDVHDPTVRIENRISQEQGVASADLRGLARDPHRGESVDRINVDGYALNQRSVPASQLSKLQFAAAYINENNSFVDVLGHSDAAGSPGAKQRVSDDRAQEVKSKLIAHGVSASITSSRLSTTTNRFTRVEGVSDRQPPPPPLRANQANWRRVEILMAGFPAGAQRPPSGTPTTVTPHRRSASVPTLRTSVDPCIRHLTRSAYP